MDWFLSNLVKIYPLNLNGNPSVPGEESDFVDNSKKIVPVSVNYFPHRKCNYACEFCFHTTTSLKMLPLDEAKRGLRLCAEAGMKKINISGGEPFLAPEFIGEIFRYCKEDLKIESCSVVNNGSKVTQKWLDKYGRYLDFMAISCDSFDPETSQRLGRGEKGKDSAKHIQRVFEVVDWCKQREIKVKINSVITSLNWEEDMNDQIEELAPVRWKVFQVLLLDGENTGASTNSIRDATNLAITDDQFQAFLKRHQKRSCLVPEDNDTMKNSYLNLDEEMRFLNSSAGSKIPGRSILDVGVWAAIADAGFDEEAFLRRGGIFDWKRDTVDDASAEDLDW